MAGEFFLFLCHLFPCLEKMRAVSLVQTSALGSNGVVIRFAILAPKFSLQFMSSPSSHPRDPLHGITLESILNQLVQRHGWMEMGRRIPIRCFQFNPTVKSSLTFLRKTPWARKKVEDWFIAELPEK